MTSPLYSTPSSAQDPAILLDSMLKAVLPPVMEHMSQGHVSSVNKSGMVVEIQTPRDFIKSLNFQLPIQPSGLEGVMSIVTPLLNRSINTWDQKFMHKLSSSTNPVGIVSEILLSVLNANVVVFQTSPVLSTIERTTAKQLANMYGFKGPRAGGICQPGGSTSNLTAVTVARNYLFPQYKDKGVGEEKLILFTSEAAHFSFQRAAMVTGIGNSQVCKVPADKEGQMRPDELRRLVKEHREQGHVPFFVNGTAGTTVYGAFDPLREISAICKSEKIWFHIDGSWGGSVIFSSKQRWRLDGCELADSITMNPHKMLGVPLPCSFLLTNDLRILHEANMINADYLFHAKDEQDNSTMPAASQPSIASASENDEYEVYDLADLTLQCGRRGDALKMALAWTYYGSAGFEERVDRGYAGAAWTTAQVEVNPDLVLVTPSPPPCLQVCFYFAPGKVLAEPEVNSKRTIVIQKELRKSGYLVDYSLGEQGYFFRVPIHPDVTKEVASYMLQLVVSKGKAWENVL